MLLSESRCLLLIHLNCIWFSLLQSSSLQVTVELQETVVCIRTSCEQGFFFKSFFSLRFPSRDGFRMTGAANELEANAKDGLLQ